MVFCKSLQFLTHLLQTLVDSKAKSKKLNQITKFSMLKRLIGDRFSAAPWKRLICKGVFPYDQVNTLAKLDDQQLPQCADFHSTLSEEPCSEDYYCYTHSIWRKFVYRTLREYMQLYLTTDLCLLSDVVDNVRAICNKAYHLDPAYFVSDPQLA